MKHIVIEGGDNLGKDSLIRSIVRYYGVENITIRHFGKPPKNISSIEDPLFYQFKCFKKEAELALYLKQSENDIYNYYENILIWNRSHIGEYVYGQMFRNLQSKEIESYIKEYELNYIVNDNLNETFLILLTADNPEFFLSKEDGHSFSKSLEEKERELNLFNEAFELSLIDNKIKIQVNNRLKFLPKEDIYNKAINFLTYK